MSTQLGRLVIIGYNAILPEDSTKGINFKALMCLDHFSNQRFVHTKLCLGPLTFLWYTLYSKNKWVNTFTAIIMLKQRNHILFCVIVLNTRTPETVDNVKKQMLNKIMFCSETDCSSSILLNLQFMFHIFQLKMTLLPTVAAKL